MIRFRNIQKSFGGRRVLSGVSFEVQNGQVFFIIGASGVGKSVLIKQLVGLLHPDVGQIWLDGEEISRLSETEMYRIRKKCAMVFQHSTLFDSMTCAQNVALPLREHTKLEESTIEIMTKIKLELVGLGGCGDLMPAQLSGGMRKRAGLARAMAMDPELIFYDEPSAGLDPIVAAGLDALIRKMQHTFNLTSVVVTHEMASVELIADTVCMLKDGRVIGIGNHTEIKAIDHPFVKQFFERRPDEEGVDNESYISSLTKPGL